jgi:hypothetical protein
MQNLATLFGDGLHLFGDSLYLFGLTWEEWKSWATYGALKLYKKECPGVIGHSGVEVPLTKTDSEIDKTTNG